MDHSRRNYSHGADEFGTPLSALSPDEFTGQIIEGSCFACEVPRSAVFPAGTRDVTFIGCNLDNVALPPGSVTLDCSTRQYTVGPDGDDWLVDDDGNLLRPLNSEPILVRAEDGTVINPDGSTA